MNLSFNFLTFPKPQAVCFSNSVPMLHVLLPTLAINRVVLHHNSSRKANYIPRSQGNVGYRRPTINLVGATENKRWKTLLNLRDTPAPDRLEAFSVHGLKRRLHSRISGFSCRAKLKCVASDSV